MKNLLNRYVDDLNNSFDNIKDAIDFYKVSKKCLADGNFILHKWATNCDELRDFINTQSHPTDVQNIGHQTYVKMSWELVKNVVKYLELIGILIPSPLSLNLTVYLKILIMKQLPRGIF